MSNQAPADDAIDRRGVDSMARMARESGADFAEIARAHNVTKQAVSAALSRLDDRLWRPAWSRARYERERKAMHDRLKALPEGTLARQLAEALVDHLTPLAPLDTLAGELGVPRPTLNQYVRGTYPPGRRLVSPTLAFLELLAALWGIEWRLTATPYRGPLTKRERVRLVFDRYGPQGKAKAFTAYADQPDEEAADG